MTAELEAVPEPDPVGGETEEDENDPYRWATEDTKDPFAGQPSDEIPLWAREARFCRATFSALWQASRTVPVRTLRYELRQRAEEWGKAAEELRTIGPLEAGICTEPVGMVVPGMKVPTWDDYDDTMWTSIVRVLRNSDSSVSIMVRVVKSGGYVKDEYRNFSHFSSPILVLS